MSCYRHNTYQFKKYFLQSLCTKSRTKSISNRAKLSAGEIELIQALKQRKKKSVIRERTEFPSFSDTLNLTFSISCFLISRTLLSTVQYTLKTLPWKMVSRTLEQLLKGILLAASLRKHTPAFHIHLAKCNSTAIPPIKQYKHICHLYTLRAMWLATET